ncbi:MAG: aminotransferase class III-fold pyridoxal phosphate-dependent enzyme [Candidatus Omnitrophica bacterium]|nr:aminotransferase class III-fold pyridoxal phosphate-dependent enzyme [Candidatus Omnitrophota bacterium]
MAPKYLQRAQGSRVWDVDGNEYIDYPMGLGALPLGHNHPAVQEAIGRQLRDGLSFSLMHPLEVEVSERLLSSVPWAEMIRFGKSGSDVTSIAVRLARASTGREMVLHCGYHGWHDWYVASTSRRRGIPEAVAALQAAFSYNDLEALRQLFRTFRNQVAAVIMEPYIVTEPAAGFLEGVRELTHANGALLVFDEVVSGFRYRWGGAYELFGVTPDLICFGKAIANGLPLSAIAGPSTIMELLEDEVFFSMTFGGETLSLAACAATLGELRKPEAFQRMWQVGRQLQEGLQALVASYGLQAHVQCLGRPPRTLVVFRDREGKESLALKSLFQQEVLKRGILFNGLQLPSAAHTEADIELTLGAFQEALAILREAVQDDSADRRLEGTPIQPVFRPLLPVEQR